MTIHEESDEGLLALDLLSMCSEAPNGKAWTGRAGELAEAVARLIAELDADAATDPCAECHHPALRHGSASAPGVCACGSDLESAVHLTVEECDALLVGAGARECQAPLDHHGFVQSVPCTVTTCECRMYRPMPEDEMVGPRCGRDFMAGQLCRLPAGHDGGHR